MIDITNNVFLSKSLTQYRQAIQTLMSALVVGELFLVKDNSDFRIFMVVAIYLACIFFLKLTSKFTFFLSLVALSCMYIQFLILQASTATEKAAVLLFFFMVIGIIQQLREK